MDFTDSRSFEAFVRPYLDSFCKASRVEHSFSVATVASILCARFGVDPERGFAAGLSHDLLKDRPLPEQWEYARRAKGRGALKGVAEAVSRMDGEEAFADKIIHGPAASVFLFENGGLVEVRIAASTDYARFSDGAFDADIVYAAAPTARVMPGMVRISLGEETVTPLCAPALAARITSPADLVQETLIHSDNKMLRWPDWFAANGLSTPAPHGLRFDRSFLAISMAADGLGVALESTRLAEREIAGGRLVAPLRGRSVDLHYLAHFLVYPQPSQANPLISRFSAWLQQELAASPHSKI